MNNNVSDFDSNIDESKQKALAVNLNPDSHGELNKKYDSNTFMKRRLTSQSLK